MADVTIYVTCERCKQITPAVSWVRGEPQAICKNCQYAELFTKAGQDWKEQVGQIIAEKACCAELGLPWPILSRN